MATVRAVKTGIWSDTTVWNTGSLPTTVDDVYSNTFTVTVDIDVTVLSINNNATTGVNAGGVFITTGSNNRGITATNGFTAVASTSTPVFRHQGSGTTTLTGDLRTLGGNNSTVFLESSGNLIINGNLITSGAGHIRPVIDVEHTRYWNIKKNRKIGVKHLKQMINFIKNETGVEPIIYTTGFFWNDFILPHYDGVHTLWVADYRKVNEPSTPINMNWSIWQFTCKAKVSGIKTKVDLNICLNIDEILIH